MARYRSILAVILAMVAAFVVSCSSPTATKPQTYSPDQISQIQGYVSEISTLRARMPELATRIENRNWSDVESFIHGPLGDLRVTMSTMARELLPDAQSAAVEKSRDVFGHLVKIDQAAREGSYEAAIRNYAEALKDFDAFVALAPKA